MHKILLLILILGLNTKSTIQNNMTPNVFEIKHSEFGAEEFLIDEPKYNLYKTEDGILEFVIAFKTTKAIKRAKKLEKIIDVKPNFEATAILPSDNSELENGKIIIQKVGYDFDRDETLSNIYYFEHNSVEELEIKIIEYHNDWIIIDVKGKAIINGSNGNEPDSELFVHRTKFLLDKALKREIM